MSEEEQKRKGTPYEVLLERFKAKVAMIPPECHEAIMLWHIARRVQEARIATENQLGQVLKLGKKVFWADEELPDAIKAVMVSGAGKSGKGVAHLDNLHKQEMAAIRACEKSFKQTRWYSEVAIAAAEGQGLGPMIAGGLLWTIGNTTRFPSFGRIVKYARLDVQNGKAPKRRKGEEATGNGYLQRTLYVLSEVWNKMPESTWRAQWDAHKAVYAEKDPELTKGHIHNMARRKVQREFLRNLYNLWNQYSTEE